ncbi:MAG TPA: CsgG/HfaB family protein [Gemmatimonadaceae bacterium]|nr:CsgG/HfaB family protein [Gemmatimonadaceae bacterium]
MLRSLSNAARLAAAAAVLALPAVARAQADTRPVVAVLPFDNNSIGKDHADYDGVGKGIQDLLITDMASNARIRLVDRERIQKVLDEQGMVKAGQIDEATAVKLGKLLGAQYFVWGGFLADAKGNMVITAHATSGQSGQISNPIKIQHKTDDALSLINELSEKMNGEIKLPPMQGRMGDAGNMGGAKSPPTQNGAVQQQSKSAPADVDFARPVKKAASMHIKLDIATMKVYSNALDEMDKKNNAKAVALFKQVTQKYPEFEPALNNLEKLGANAS